MSVRSVIIQENWIIREKNGLSQARVGQRLRRRWVDWRGSAVGARNIQRRWRHVGEPCTQPAARREHACRRKLVLYTGESRKIQLYVDNK